jgi:hypothetical protein
MELYHDMVSFFLLSARLNSHLQKPFSCAESEMLMRSSDEFTICGSYIVSASQFSHSPYRRGSFSWQSLFADFARVYGKHWQFSLHKQPYSNFKSQENCSYMRRGPSRNWGPAVFMEASYSPTARFSIETYSDPGWLFTWCSRLLTRLGELRQTEVGYRLGEINIFHVNSM